jgi:hypothetical protein
MHKPTLATDGFVRCWREKLRRKNEGITGISMLKNIFGAL